MINVQKKVDKIHIKESRKGLLHKNLHIAQGTKIPASVERKKLVAAKAAGNVPLEKRLVFALNFSH
jgi:hypothetical protein